MASVATRSGWIPRGIEKIQEGRPLVVILGFLGANEKQTGKYAEVYETFGCATLQGTAPRKLLTRLGGTHVRRRELATQIMQDSRDMLSSSEKSNGVLIHLMSNGGAFLFEEMLYLCEQDEFQEFRKAVRGIVLDSAPAKLHLRTGLRAFRDGKKSFLLESLLAPLDFLIGGESTFWNKMKTHNTFSGKPELYLCSKGDEIVELEFSGLKELIEFRKSLTDVSAKVWDSSPHVQHLRFHKEEYFAEISQFLEKI